MADQIKVVIVDDIAETRDHLAKLLSFESDIKVVGSAASGAQALEFAGREPVDVVLLDINMPDLDGIATAEQLALRAPTAATIMMSVQGDPTISVGQCSPAHANSWSSRSLPTSSLPRFARSTNGSARSWIASQKPCPWPTAKATRAAMLPGGEGKVVTFFSPKGGVGRTTLAVNFAVAAHAQLGKKVVIVDGGLQFGDVGVMLNLNPKNQSIADVCA